ncbi:MAG: phosphotransferase [Nevskia sp.]|nr:phosphotransferase [Nevskia sp.]
MDDIRSLVPHAGAMCLLEQVERWDEATVVCRTASHLRADHPLRRDGTLSAVHLIEYAAQAIAVHRGLLARASGEILPPGWLVAVRDVRLLVPRLDQLPAPLTIVARELVVYQGGTQYGFSALAGDLERASGRVSVVPVPGSGG